MNLENHRTEKFSKSCLKKFCFFLKVVKKIEFCCMLYLRNRLVGVIKC